ncbi:HdeD family acid-resistance protein [Yersinia rohdei]|nr:membrane protein [Yersinia rohdei]
MVQLVMILLGVDYLRNRWRGLMIAGCLGVLAGLIVFIDALDNVIYFPLNPFACLLLLEGVATLMVAHTGIGGQRTLRYVKGGAFSLAALLILSGQHHGHFILSMIFGTLFLADGLLQIVSAGVVRYKNWKFVVAGGVLEVMIAIFFFQPYPTHYAGTVPYCLGLGLMFGGWNMVMLAMRVKKLKVNPAFLGNKAAEKSSSAATTPMVTEWDGPPAADEPALTVHVWTPVGSSKGTIVPHPVIDRYIAAVDKNGVISTGHAALESPEGVYISLYPAVDLDRSPEQFSRLLRATADNNVEGQFQPDYVTESEKWCPSTTQVRIRNYDAKRLKRFWEIYREDNTYNLTHRNCSSSAARGLEAALEGVVGKIWGQRGHWWVLSKILTTPELWVAVQIRKRAKTMAWTPGLTLDYARALSMLADPRPAGWVATIRRAVRKMSALRQQWRKEKAQATIEEDARNEPSNGKGK